VKDYILDILRRFLSREDGVTAVEFALVVIPFIIILGGIFEVALVFTTANVLEGTTSAAARAIRTGQVQDASDPVAFFEDMVCEGMRAFAECSEIEYEVFTPSNDDFSSASDDMQPQFDSDGNLIANPFDPGGVSDVAVVRTVYRYEVLAPLLAPLMGGQNGEMLMVSTITVRNEPYAFE
jgi:Flp pilus assembly protein TadG